MYNKSFNQIYSLWLKRIIAAMESKINNVVQIGQALSPLKNVAKVSNIDKKSDLQDVFTKIDKLKKLWDDGSMDYEFIRYLPGMAKI